MDLGECSKIHDLALRADYEIASKERDLFFELDVSTVNIFITIITIMSVLNPFSSIDQEMLGSHCSNRADLH